jgi:hypothetical protein
MKKLNQYYLLSELLGFDTYLVSVVINHFLDKDIDTIFKNLQDLNIEEYQGAIDEALDLPVNQLKLISEDSWFKSESSYIRYLESLLSLNNIEYIGYKPKKEVKSKYETGSLF